MLRTIKVQTLILSILYVGVHAEPQISLDQFNKELQDVLGGPFDPNPKYNYAYQISDDTEQTYITHKENRDGANVAGEYSYVDPLGSLITVKYTAGPDGYLESRNVQEGFVTIRQQSVVPPSPASPAQRPAAFQQQSTAATTVASSSGETDLVARIISQLTPFIQQTVSNTLASTQRQSTISLAAPAPLLTPARAPVRG